MVLNQPLNLPDCLITTNCVRIENTYANSQEIFEKLVQAASSLPRVQVIHSSKNYWHGVVRSLIFRFPDDLEILNIPSKNKIQIRSCSRIGLSDLGVNKKRVDDLFRSI